MATSQQDTAARAEYLAYLRENSLSEADILPLLPPEIDPESQAKVDAVLAQARAAGMHRLLEQIADAQTRNTNDLLAVMNAALVKRFARAGFQLKQPVYAGVFPMNTFNAHSVMRPNTYLILVDTGLFEMLGAMTAILASLDVGTARTQAKLAATLIRQYCDERLLPTYAQLKAIALDGDRQMLGIHAASAAEEFVLAHEYAHILRGDTGHLLGSNGPMKAVDKNEGEVEADLWAADAVLRVAESEEEQIIRGTGPLVFLATSGLMEAYWEQKKEKPRSDTHPPAGNRIVQLRYSLAKAGLNETTQLGATFYKFSLLVGEELGLTISARAAELQIADSVGNMVADGLQKAEPLVKQTFRIFERTPAAAPPKPWWKFLKF
ncbi:MAG TPA: hypothetical protein VLC46_01030 [Thermoanaerobaculia bacterium]|nr:hypothetical protein [Thermoanaerobaculia bacterium]